MNKSIYILSAGMFALGLDAYVIAGVLPNVAASYDINLSSAGIAVALFTTFYALSAPLFAVVLAGKPARLVLCIATRLGRCRHLSCRKGASWQSPGPYSRRYSLGVVIGVPIGLAMAGLAGWQLIFWMIAALGITGFIAVLALFPAIAPPPPPSVKERLTLLNDWRVLGIVAVTFLIGAASLGLYIYTAPILAQAGQTGHLTIFLWAWGVAVLSAVSRSATSSTGRATRNGSSSGSRYCSA